MDVNLHVIKNCDEKIINVHNELNKVIENKVYIFYQFTYY